MSEEVKNIAVLILGGIFGAFGRYYYDYKGSVYRQHWTERYRVYQALFIFTGLMPRCPHRTTVTYLEVLKNSEAMRDWYFHEGGLMASSKKEINIFNFKE